MRAGWEIKKLGEVCDILDSQRIPITKNQRIKGPYPYYGACGVLDYVSDYIFNEKLVLLGEDGAKWGPGEQSAYMITGKTWVNNHAHVLRPIPTELLHKWLIYYLNHSDLTIYITGITVPKLNQSKTLTIPIPVPPLSEQERIVAELDMLNGVIEKKREQLTQLDALAQSIFYDMFGDPITNEKGWEICLLKNVAKIVGGSTPKTNIEEYWNGNKYWVTPAELHGTRYISATERCITDKAVKETHLTLLPPGTVLLSSRAPIGKVCITRVPMYCNQGFKNIICSERLHNEYVYQYFLDKAESLNSLGSGATFKEISKAVTEKIPIPVPPLSLQRRFAEKIEAIEQQKERICQSLAEVQRLFDSRMDYYFNEWAE